MSVRFGEIPGIEPGTWFPHRMAVRDAGLHTDWVKGISWSKGQGADAIVLSGGYEDDRDHGDVIIYTGEGGNDPSTKAQIASQSLTRGNLALAISYREGHPVRVIRGSGLRHSEYKPEQGYEYAGLYRIDSYWQQPGQSGHLVWQFRLVAIDPTKVVQRAPTQTMLHLAAEELGEYDSTERREQPIQRIVRSSAHAEAVKRFYDYRCQVCLDGLRTPAGLYVEAAHIRPLGIPHNGPDALDNLLSLCPNHHVMLDFGGLVLSDEFVAFDTWTEAPVGELHLHPKHPINLDHVRYHRNLFVYR